MRRRRGMGDEVGDLILVHPILEIGVAAIRKV